MPVVYARSLDFSLQFEEDHGACCSLPERARPFANVYAPSRVLNDLYHVYPGSCDVVQALVTWGIAFPQPLIRDNRAELKDTVLQHLTDADVKGVIVRDQEFSQVALLASEVIQRCQETEEQATLLLSFILGYLAPTDGEWQKTRSVVGKRDGKEVTLQLSAALWLAELQSRAWIPMQTEKGTEPVLPTQANLAPLIKGCKEHLIGNDSAIKLLIKCFGFNVLEIHLEALPADVREIISETLAKVIQMGGDDAEFYQEVVKNLETQEQRAAEKERNRQFGLAVQAAIQSYLEKQGLTVDVIDCGYDLDVGLAENLPLLDAGTHTLALGPFHVEVKATTTGEVRLTPSQARLASSDDDFVLCVVDLRGYDAARLVEPWTAEDIEPLAVIVTGLREQIEITHRLVERATEQEIAIRNESNLRYGVPTTIWESGNTIDWWVEENCTRLTDTG
jgi:hypothetical protein